MLGAIFHQCEPRGWQHCCRPQLEEAWGERWKSSPTPSHAPCFLEARQEWSTRGIRPNDYKGGASGVQWGKCLKNQVHKVSLFLIATWSRRRWNGQKMTNLVKENEYNLIIYKVKSPFKQGSFFKLRSVLKKTGKKETSVWGHSVTYLPYKDLSELLRQNLS